MAAFRPFVSPLESLKLTQNCTSPFRFASLASSAMTFIASQAHLTLPLDQSSISRFLFGAYTVGHSTVFSLSEVAVNAAVLGTLVVYGSGRGMFSGNGGMTMVGDARLSRSVLVFVVLFLRTRLR